MNVWSYWSGPKPHWIQTCLDSIQRCCVRSKFHLVTPENWKQYVTLPLPKRWLELPPGVGTDCLRSVLLAEHGGLWIDADTVCLKDPQILLDGQRYADKQFLFSRWTDNRVIAGYVYSPKGHQVAMQWYDTVVSALKHADGIGWGDLGETTLTPIVRRAKELMSSRQLPLSTFLPIDIDKSVTTFFNVGDWKTFVTNRTIAFGMNHSWMQDKKPVEMSYESLNGPLLVHRLLRDAARLNARPRGYRIPPPAIIRARKGLPK